MSTIDDPGLVVTDEVVEETTIIRCVGEIDVATAPRLRDRIARLQVDGPARVVVDLSGVTFIDSIGLGALIGGHKRARVLQGSMVIVPSAAASRLFAATALDRVFVVRPTVAEALAASRTE